MSKYKNHFKQGSNWGSKDQGRYDAYMRATRGLDQDLAFKALQGGQTFGSSDRARYNKLKSERDKKKAAEQAAAKKRAAQQAAAKKKAAQQAAARKKAAQQEAAKKKAAQQAAAKKKAAQQAAARKKAAQQAAAKKRAAEQADAKKRAAAKPQAAQKTQTKSSNTNSFKVGGDAKQNIGKVGNMTTKTTNSKFGAGASVGNDKSVTVGNQNIGNRVSAVKKAASVKTAPKPPVQQSVQKPPVQQSVQKPEPKPPVQQPVRPTAVQPKVTKPAPIVNDNSFEIGKDLNQNIGKKGDMNTTVTNSTFGAGASVGNDYSVTIGNQNAGNMFGSSGEYVFNPLSNMQSATAYNALNDNSLAKSRSQVNGYGRAAGAIEEARKGTQSNSKMATALNFVGQNQKYMRDKINQIREGYMGNMDGYQAPSYKLPIAPRPVDLDPAKDIYKDAMGKFS